MVSGPGLCNFIAMEYYSGILNRTFRISGFENGIFGVRILQMISNPGFMSPRLAIDPHFYVNPVMLARYVEMKSDPSCFLHLDKANFCYAMGDISSISIDLTPKWGMGNVRYSGRILIGLKSGMAREFILLGLQDTQAIADELNTLWQSQIHRMPEHLSA